MHPVLRSLEADLLTATAKVGERDLEREREDKEWGRTREIGREIV